jgi:TPR repeat protein
MTFAAMNTLATPPTGGNNVGNVLVGASEITRMANPSDIHKRQVKDAFFPMPAFTKPTHFFLRQVFSAMAFMLAVVMNPLSDCHAGSNPQGTAQKEAAAQYQHGKAYDEKGNYTEAIKWYRKAAEQGDADAQANLGWIYAEGRVLYCFSHCVTVDYRPFAKARYGLRRFIAAFDRGIYPAAPNGAIPQKTQPESASIQRRAAIKIAGAGRDPK